jgi:hypothetical protein
MRDDFDNKTKETLAKRVGFRCSNPNCRKLTSGPQDDVEKSINIGVAAHICAASRGGPRYIEKQSSDERKSIENGIWLCQNCAKLIDNDEKHYSADILNEWKKLSEQAALLEIQNKNLIAKSEDKNIIQNFAQCFDRPAFQDPFRQEGSMEAFDKAIEDTIIALNTGTLRSRDGTILNKSQGKAFLESVELRNQIDVILNLLRAIRERYSLALKNNEIHLGNEHSGRQFYCFHNQELSIWFDATRSEILTIFENICSSIGISWKSRFPRHRMFW